MSVLGTIRQLRNLPALLLTTVALLMALTVNGGESPAAAAAPPAPEVPAAFIPTRAASLAKLQDVSIPAACGMQIKGYAGETDFDKLKEMGVSFVRRGFHWEGVEKEKGVYDFTGHDVIMTQLRDRGIRVVGCLAFGNKLYPKVVTPEGREAYARYAAALAEHFKADKVMWEIWNEPNTRTFWGSQGGGKSGNTEAYAEQYVNLVRTVVPEMRKADPNCTILAGSASCLWSATYNWLGFCAAKGLLKTGIDAVSLHPYDPKMPEDYISAYGTVRDIFAKNGGPSDFPMINTERGFGTGNTVEGAIDGEENMKVHYQAWGLVRQQLMDVVLGMHGTAWYEWKNEKEHFGIYNGDKPNRACDAYTTLIAQLRGYRFSKRLETTRPEDFVYVFSGPDGGIKLAVWTGVPKPVAAAPEAANAPPQPKAPAPKGPKPKTGFDATEPHEVSIPVDASGTLAVASIYGVQSTMPVVAGKITIKLEGGPQYITVKAKP